ncbi:MAG: glutamate--tRNA ligase family protein [Candidatus ainarchaeum sp.]|nr:glutamate--tRNA ligase family protein [Candidatus ainarchaeum sp.]
MQEIKIPGKGINEIKRIAYKYAIKNCFEHKGKAEIGAVIGKVKAILPETIIGQAIPIVKEVIEKTNKMKKEEIEEEYYLFEKSGWELKQVEKEKTLPELNWLEEEKLITRAAPCPTGAMHFGHARPYILLDEYVKKYGGKYILRFDDTDPKIKIPEKGIEEEFQKDFEWLEIKIHEIKRQSDNIGRYLKIVEQLIAEEKAYICFCKPEEWRKKIWEGKACECREKKAREQIKHWKEMVKGKLKEGSCVVRLKTNLEDKDSSTRDWWLAKIVDDPTKHPNKKTHKYHVWPSYNLASSIDDHEMKINFIIRGQEHIQNEKKQKYLYDYFKWKYPHTMYHGKITKVADMILSKSKIKLLMEKEGLKRDDDPRLATIKSFRRRGFRPETIRKVILQLGLNPNDAKIGLENFGSSNKKFLGEVKNYPFIEEGLEIEIINFMKGKTNAYEQELLLEEPIQKFVVDKKEIKNIRVGENIRFKEGFNVKIEEIGDFGAKGRFISYEKTGYKTIDWLKEFIDVKILMADGKEKIGMSVPNIQNEKEGNVIFFNGIGYVRIDNKTREVYCVFAHK